MKDRLILFLAMLCAVAQGAWATDYRVKNDSELRAAIQNNGANIQLAYDIQLSNSTLSIESGKTVTIDLNGHTLDRKLTKRGEGGGQVITVREGATLNLTGGTLTGGWGGAGGALVNEGGTLTITNVIITNNVADDRGGGVCNRTGGTLTMTDCSITNNLSNDKSGSKGGGGLFNEEGATAVLTGVTITGNKAKWTGGGGICNFGTLTLDGCTITDNNAYTNGGAIWQEGTLNMQGANVISDNTASSGSNNVYLYNGKVITVTGSLAGSSIGITMHTAGTFTSGYKTHNSGTDPATIFQPEWPEVMTVSLDADNEAQLINSLPDGDVYYVERSWDDASKSVKAEIKILHKGDYTVMDGGSNAVIGAGNFVVKGNVKYNKIECTEGEKHHLILCDGAKLTTNFVRVEEDNELYIYGQTNDSGELMVNSEKDVTHAGIGCYLKKCGTIIIHGGYINTTGCDHAAGIGGGKNQNGGNVIIYGGTIKAYGGKDGAGIGGGSFADEDQHDWTRAGIRLQSDYKSTITIYGGIVKAWGGEYAAGIGIGSYSGIVKENTSKLIVNGGEVYAYGGNDAAGIGGGVNASGSDVTINGGYVYAKGYGNGAGIGSGCAELWSGDKQGGSLTVTGGRVEAYGGVDAAGIGGGEDVNGGTVVISGGYVYAEGNDYGPGIGGGQGAKGGEVTITGGTVIAKKGENATGAIGSGDGDDNGSLTLGDDRCVLITSNLWRCQKANRVNDCFGASYLQISECLHGDATATVVDGDKHSISNCKWCYTTGEGTHYFGDDSQCDACQLIRLVDEGDNSALFSKWADNQEHDFVLSGRKLIPNEEGSRAYTVCLPFDMDLTGNDNLTVWTLSYIKDGSEMVFTQTSKKIEAGKPYLIVISQSELELLGHSKLTTTAGEGVRVYDFTDREQPLGWWRGTLTKIESADAADMMAYALQKVGDFRRIRHDTPYAWWGAFRSMYCPDELPGTNKFTINRGAFNGLGGQTVTISFEGDAEIEDTTTGITITNYPNLTNEAGAWYDMLGRRLSGKPLRAGVYINNGIKSVIK